jgi:hypothetical protein
MAEELRAILWAAVGSLEVSGFFVRPGGVRILGIEWDGTAESRMVLTHRETHRQTES